MSVRPTNEGDPYPLLASGVGYDADANTDDIEPPPDRMIDANAQIPVYLAGDYVQSQQGSWTSNTTTFATPPTEGNTLLAFLYEEESTDGAISGWTLVADASGRTIDRVSLWSKVAGAAESSSVTGTATHLQILNIVEVNGAQAAYGTVDAGSGDATTFIGPTLSGFAGAVMVTAFQPTFATYVNPTVAPSGSLVELGDQKNGRTLHWFGYEELAATASVAHSIVSSARPYDVSPTYDFGAISAIYGSGVTWVSSVEVNDQDDATYGTVAVDDDGSICRVMLDEAYRLAASVLKIGYSAAGSHTLDLVGANAADFSDAVTLDTVTMTATGGYASDSVSFTLPNLTAYQFYRLEGDPVCRIFTWELYEANDEAAAATIASHLVDTTDAHDASAISVLDAGGYFTGTNVESVLAEIGAAGLDGGPDVELVSVAAAGATETIDVSVARTYDVTLTADCTITLTGAVNDEAWFVTVFLRQDGTGGWDVTWPGSVEWPTGGAPTIDPDPNAVTVVTLGTLDGGTVWYGFPTGGGTTGGGDTSGQFVAGWDGGGSALASGAIVDIVAPFAGTITSWTLLPDQSGSAAVDIGTDTYAGYPTFTSIVAAAPPTLTSATKATSSTLTGWTTGVTAGDILRFTLSSATTVTRLLCVVAYSRP